jgi:hypothetical protein
MISAHGMNQEAVIVKMLGSATNRSTTGPSEILNAVGTEGWGLGNGSFVFVEQGPQSRDKFLSSGQNVAIKDTASRLLPVPTLPREPQSLNAEAAARPDAPPSPRLAVRFRPCGLLAIDSLALVQRRSCRQSPASTGRSAPKALHIGGICVIAEAFARSGATLSLSRPTRVRCLGLGGLPRPGERSTMPRTGYWGRVVGRT